MTVLNVSGAGPDRGIEMLRTDFLRLRQRVDEIESAVGGTGAILSSSTLVSAEVTSTGFGIGTANTWIDTAAASIPRPSWANKVLVIVSGYTLLAGNTTGFAQPADLYVSSVRLRVQGAATLDTPARQYFQGENQVRSFGQLSWSQVLRDPGSSVTAAIQMKIDRNTNPGHSESKAMISLSAFWIREAR